jgi:hypothetical protein
VILHRKSVLCFEHRENCYGALYDPDNPDSDEARRSMEPRRILRAKVVTGSDNFAGSKKEDSNLKEEL